MRANLLSLSILLLAVLQILIPLTQNHFPLLDFYAYRGAALAQSRGQNPYVLQFPSPEGNLNFIYPPSSFLFFFWLPLLSLYLSKLIFTYLSLVAGLASLLILQRTFWPHRPIYLSLLITALYLQTFPAKLNLGFGQINLWMLFFVSLSLFLFPRRPAFSAISLGLATAFKLHPLFLIPYFIFRREWRFLITFLVTVLVLNAGFPQLSIYYLTHVLPGLSATTMAGTSMYNQSLAAFLYRLSAWPYSPLLATAFMVVGYLGYLVHHHHPHIQEFAWLLALITLWPINAWQHQLVLAYPFLISLSAPWLILIWPALAYHPAVEPPASLVSALTVSAQTLLILLLLVRNFRLRVESPGGKV